MDRLKQEWKETTIPEEVRLRARNIAWVKIQHKRGSRRALAWAAASTVIAIAVLVWIWSSHDASLEQVEVHPPQGISHPFATTNQTEKPVTEIQQALKQAHPPVDQIQTGAPVEGPERIVLNFTLPESGARMIWIMDSRFQLNGGVK